MKFILLVLIIIFSAQYTFSQSWEIFGELKFPRNNYQLEHLSESRLIVMGGVATSGATNSCEIIDAETFKIRDAASMNYPRSFFKSVVLPDGKILVAGGARAVEVYDPLSNTWQVVGQLLEDRYQNTATLVNDSLVLVIGGWVTATCELFNYKTGVSQWAASFPYRTTQPKAFTTKDGRIFSFGGRSGGPNSYRSAYVHEYDVKSNAWKVSGNAADSLYLPTITYLNNGGIVWTGGSYAESNSADSFTNTLAIFNNGGFANIGSLIDSRVGHGAVDLGGGRIIVIGGVNNSKRPMKQCEYIDLATGFSAQGPPLNVGHGYFIAATCRANNKLFVFAVSGSDRAPVEVLEIGCDPTTSEMSVIQDATLRGVARVDNNLLRLTDNSTYAVGAAWIRSKVRVYPTFGTVFSFRLLDGSDRDLKDGGPAGADGVTLVIQNRVPAALGKPGHGIGYEGVPHGVAVEFDSYLNAEYSDPAPSHVAIQVGDGTKLMPIHALPYVRAVTYTNVPDFRADGTIYNARILYENNILRVWLDTTGLFEIPLLEIPINIMDELQLGADGGAYVGITSATGYSVEVHEILSWTLEGCYPLATSVDDASHTTDPSVPLRILPNPVTEDATVVMNRPAEGDGLVIVTNLQGVTVWEAEINAGTESFTIPTGMMSSGVYSVSVFVGQERFVSIFNIIK